MKQFIVSKEYSYVDARGVIHQSGKYMTLDETSEHVKSQLYKLIEVKPEPEEKQEEKQEEKPEEKPEVKPQEMKKETIVEKMVTKMLDEDAKKPEAKPAFKGGSIKERMQDMIEKQKSEKKG